jgi:hypothetical protein
MKSSMNNFFAMKQHLSLLLQNAIAVVRCTISNHL